MANKCYDNDKHLPPLLVSRIKTFLISYQEELRKKRFGSSSSSTTLKLLGYGSNNVGVPDPTTANALNTATVVLRKRASKKKNSPLDGVPLANYRLRPHELYAEVFDWINHFLWLKKCPIELATLVANKIAVKTMETQTQNNQVGDAEFVDELIVHKSSPMLMPDGESECSLNNNNNTGGVCPEISSINSIYPSERSSLVGGALASHDVARHSRELVDEYLDELSSNPEQAVSMVQEYMESPTKESQVFTSSVHAIKNRRQSMEDRHIIIHNLNKALNLDLPKTYSYYAIFDGHAGIDAASYSTAHLHHYLVESDAFQNGQIEEAFREAFEKTDALYIKRCKEDGLDKMKPSGTTAICALIEDNKTVYLAWAGDSQALLVRNGCHEEIMLPHKPDLDSERIRIQKDGGFVIYLDTWRVNGILSVTRAIGDPEHKPSIIADPSFSSFTIDSSLDFLVLGCDGLFDHLTGQDITSHVFEYLCKNENENPEKVVESVSEYLATMAINEGSCDNITSIVVFFKPFEQLISTGFPKAVENNHEMLDNVTDVPTPLTTTNGGHFPYTDFSELPIGTNYKLTSEESAASPIINDEVEVLNYNINDLSNENEDSQMTTPFDLSNNQTVINFSKNFDEENIIPNINITNDNDDSMMAAPSPSTQILPEPECYPLEECNRKIELDGSDDDMEQSLKESVKDSELVVCECVDEEDLSGEERCQDEFDFVRTPTTAADINVEPVSQPQAEVQDKTEEHISEEDKNISDQESATHEKEEYPPDVQSSVITLEKQEVDKPAVEIMMMDQTSHDDNNLVPNGLIEKPSTFMTTDVASEDQSPMDNEIISKNNENLFLSGIKNEESLEPMQNKVLSNEEIELIQPNSETSEIMENSENQNGMANPFMDSVNPIWQKEQSQKLDDFIENTMPIEKLEKTEDSISNDNENSCIVSNDMIDQPQPLSTNDYCFVNSMKSDDDSTSNPIYAPIDNLQNNGSMIPPMLLNNDDSNNLESGLLYNQHYDTRPEDSAGQNSTQDLLNLQPPKDDENLVDFDSGNQLINSGKSEALISEPALEPVDQMVDKSSFDVVSDEPLIDQSFLVHEKTPLSPEYIDIKDQVFDASKDVASVDTKTFDIQEETGDKLKEFDNILQESNDSLNPPLSNQKEELLIDNNNLMPEEVKVENEIVSPSNQEEPAFNEIKNKVNEIDNLINGKIESGIPPESQQSLIDVPKEESVIENKTTFPEVTETLKPEPMEESKTAISEVPEEVKVAATTVAAAAAAASAVSTSKVVSKPKSIGKTSTTKSPITSKSPTPAAKPATKTVGSKLTAAVKTSTTRPLTSTISSSRLTTKPALNKVSSSASNLKPEVKKPSTSVASKLNTRPASTSTKPIAAKATATSTLTAAPKPRIPLSSRPAVSTLSKASTLKTSTNAAKDSKPVASKPPTATARTLTKPSTTKVATTTGSTAAKKPVASSKINSPRPGGATTAGTNAKTASMTKPPARLPSSSALRTNKTTAAAPSTNLRKAAPLTTAQKNTQNSDTKKPTTSSVPKKVPTPSSRTVNGTSVNGKLANGSTTAPTSATTTTTSSTAVKVPSHKRNNLIQVENSLKQELEDAVAAAAAASAIENNDIEPLNKEF